MIHFFLHTAGVHAATVLGFAVTFKLQEKRNHSTMPLALVAADSPLLLMLGVRLGFATAANLGPVECGAAPVRARARTDSPPAVRR